MKHIKITEEFEKWFTKLKDRKTRIVIQSRIDRLEEGHYGDNKYLTDGVSELRIFFGAGYRIYFCERDGEIIIILAGGTKSGQSRDIKKAIEIATRF